MKKWWSSGLAMVKMIYDEASEIKKDQSMEADHGITGAIWTGEDTFRNKICLDKSPICSSKWKMVKVYKFSNQSELVINIHQAP